MRRAGAALLLLAAVMPLSRAAAQASEFSVRSLGLPLRPVSTATQGTGSGFAMFDPTTPLNPAALSLLARSVATFGIRHHWRNSENPYGSTSGNDTQFPLISVGGAATPRLGLGISASGYTDRTFAVPLQDTLIVRDSAIVTTDTLISKGGVTDVRVAGSLDLSERVSIGVGLHLLTGTNRFEYRRKFSDSVYFPVRLRNELSVVGPGVSVGLLAEPVSGFRVSGMFRWDGDVTLYRDSTRVGKVPMPLTFAVGAQWGSDRVQLGTHALARTWSVQHDYSLSQGGTGASNTLEVSAGGQLITDPVQTGRFPLRFGARWASLPYPPSPGGATPRELGISAGTGFVFGGGRGLLDFAVEQTWRSAPGGFSEQNFSLAFGVTIRP